MKTMSSRFLIIVFLLFVTLLKSNQIKSESLSCLPYTKRVSNNSSCLPVVNEDIYESLHWLTNLPTIKTTCNNIVTIDGISVCQDHISTNCVIWSLISVNECQSYGSLLFEKYWSQHNCKVILFHFYPFMSRTTCSDDNLFTEYPNITLIRNDMWSGRCYNCFYKLLKKYSNSITSMTSIVDILKIQVIPENYDLNNGVQYTILSDLYSYYPQITLNIKQIIFIASLNSNILYDRVGRELSHGWNIFATSQFLLNYATFSHTKLFNQYPINQFDRLLSRINIQNNNNTIESYSYHSIVSLIRIDDLKWKETQSLRRKQWKSIKIPKLLNVVPKYCTIPSQIEYNNMDKWINNEINSRCHPTRYKLSLFCLFLL